MHDSHKIRTLLACIDDLTKAVQDMSAEASIHQADQDLLLYRSRLFYEAVLCMPTAEAVAPVAPVPASTEKDEAKSSPETPIIAMALGDAAEQDLEKTVKQVITQTQEVELSFEVAATAEAAPSVEDQEVIEAPEPVQAAEVPSEEAVVQEAVAEEVAAANSAEEVQAETPPAAAPVEAAPAKSPAKTVTFSLTGIIERSGDSNLVMAHLKLKPIDDLKSGIGLNEKFLFIRELFGNDHLAYADAIEKLNAAPNLDAAEQILSSEVLPKQQWDLDTEAALSFLHLIFRRFAQA